MTIQIYDIRKTRKKKTEKKRKQNLYLSISSILSHKDLKYLLQSLALIHATLEHLLGHHKKQ